MKIPIFILMLVLFAANSHAKDITFYSFSLGSVTPVVGPGQSVTNLGGGVEVKTNDNSLTYTAIESSNWVYNFSDGAIKSVELLGSYNEVYTFGQGQAYGVLAVQDGKFFQGSYNITLDSGGKISIYSDFRGTGVDFSIGAKPIVFGLYTANSGGQGITIQYIDLHMIIHVDDDMCPQDPNKTKPGKCGCGYADITEIQKNDRPDSNGNINVNAITENPSDVSVYWKIEPNIYKGNTDVICADISPEQGATATVTPRPGVACEMLVTAWTSESCKKTADIKIGACEECSGGGDCKAAGGGDAGLTK